MSSDDKYMLLKNLINQDPIEFAKQHRFSDDCINVLKNISIKSEDLSSCSYLSDNRSTLKYTQEIVRTWVKENFIRDKLNQIPNVYAYLEGGDNRREFLNAKKVRTDPDFIIRIIQDELFFYDEYLVELIADYGSFWEKNGVCHLRDNKLFKLIKLSETQNVFLLAVDVVKKTMGFIQINPETEYRYIESHSAFGGKPAYEIRIDTSKFFSVDDIKLSCKELERAS